MIFFFFCAELIVIHVPNPIQSITISLLKKIFRYKKIVVFYHSEILILGKLGEIFNSIEKKLCVLADVTVFSSVRYAKSVLGFLLDSVNVVILPYTRINTTEPIFVEGLPHRYALVSRLAPYKPYPKQYLPRTRRSTYWQGFRPKID